MQIKLFLFSCAVVLLAPEKTFLPPLTEDPIQIVPLGTRPHRPCEELPLTVYTLDFGVYALDKQLHLIVESNTHYC